MQLTGVRGGFSVGSGPRRLAVPGAPPASPLICYEIIFPDEITEQGERPGWLLNVTNDAWFGTSAGSLPALPSSTSARDRAGLAGRPRRQHRHLGGDRSLRTNSRRDRSRRERRARRGLAQSGPDNSLRAVRNHSRNLGVAACFCRLVRLSRATCWTAPLTQQEQKCRAAPACLTGVNRTPMNDREMGAIISSSFWASLFLEPHDHHE